MIETIEKISSVIVTTHSVKGRNPFGTTATLILVSAAYTILLLLVAEYLL